MCVARGALFVGYFRWTNLAFFKVVASCFVGCCVSFCFSSCRAALLGREAGMSGVRRGRVDVRQRMGGSILKGKTIDRGVSLIGQLERYHFSGEVGVRSKMAALFV